MDPNNNHVTTDLSYGEEALDLLSHADHVESEIEALTGAGDRSLNARISDAHKELGITFKRADILATLAIAEANVEVADSIERLRQTLVVLGTPAARPDRPEGFTSLSAHLAHIAAGDPHR